MTRALCFLAIAGMSIALFSSQAHAQSRAERAVAELRLRLDQSEAEVRRLNGTVEELQFQIRQLSDQLRRFQEDTEFRFQEIEGPSPFVDQEESAEPPRAQTFNQDTQGETLGTLNQRPASGGATVQNDAPGSGPLDLAAIARGQVPVARPAESDLFRETAPAEEQTGQPVSSGLSANVQYDAAYGFILRGDYETAEIQFRQFLNDHPNDRLTPDAQFWLGESLYARGLYRDAADTFLQNYNDFPESQKAAESLLKLGMSLKNLNETEVACVTFTEVLERFPDAPAPIKQRAREEQAAVRCSG